MADSGNKPGHFNIREPNAESPWQLWRAELEFYIDALGVDVGDNRSRIAMLMSLVGPETREVYNQFEFANPDDAKCDRQVRGVLQAQEELNLR